jgi:hypothetical protein
MPFAYIHPAFHFIHDGSLEARAIRSRLLSLHKHPFTQEYLMAENSPWELFYLEHDSILGPNSRG